MRTETLSSEASRTTAGLEHDCETIGSKVGAEQSVMVHVSNFRLGDSNSDPFFAVDEQLYEVISESGVGEYDGNGIGRDGADYFAYGRDADALWEVMRPIIVAASPSPGSYVDRTYGDAGESKVKSTSCNIG